MKTIKQKISILYDFFTETLWHYDFSKKGLLVNSCCQITKVIILTIFEFIKKRCWVNSAALTYYSILAIIPILALAFGIAKGFSLENNLEYILKNKIANNTVSYAVSSEGSEASPESQENLNLAIEKFINAIKKALETTNGGVITGIGVALLIWWAIGLISNIEKIFNTTWNIHHSRNWQRKLIDYIPLILLGPIIMIFSSGVALFLNEYVSGIASHINFIDITPMLSVVLKILQYGIMTFLFAFLYMFLPNTKVKFLAALISGFITAISFIFLQWLYIKFQIGISSANKIYGGLAALPLLLIWIQVSWAVVLLGANISNICQNINNYSFYFLKGDLSQKFYRTICIMIMQIISKRFMNNLEHLTDQELSRIMNVPIHIIQFCTNKLVLAGLLLRSNKNGKQIYVNANNPKNLTIFDVICELNNYGLNIEIREFKKQNEKLSDLLLKLEALIKKSEANIKLIELELE